ncbi:hypothetical protein MUP59_10125, partial [Candidatus Bathyarchaeota archaeon]|nr:hypothetical protein [Candidatus Bathyarchaeota archaeon]
GSGFYGHAGRPGLHGGSAPGHGLIVTDTFTAKHSNRAVIMNGKVYEGDENKGAYHTPIYARIVLANTEDFDRVVVGMANEINRENAPEDSVFESRVMEKTDAYSIEVVGPMSRIVIAQDKYPKRSTVSQGINNLLRKVQRDVKRGIIDLPYISEINLNFSTAWVSFPFSEIDDVAQIIWDDQYLATIQYKHVVVVKGGSGSGDFGHQGRPGEVGGSSGGKGAAPARVVFNPHAGGRTSKIPIDMQNAYRSKAKEMGYEGNMRFEESYEGDVEVYGYYDNTTNTIVICDRSWKDKKGKQALAHEISHAKWSEVTDASANEDKRTQDFDNYVNNHEVVLYEAGMNIQLPYAKKFWEEYGAYGEYDTPMNETFAEFSRKVMQYGGDASQVKTLVGADNPLWLAYEKFEEAYASLHK